MNPTWRQSNNNIDFFFLVLCGHILLGSIYGLLSIICSFCYNKLTLNGQKLHEIRHTYDLLDWLQCGNSLALCYFAVVMELPDS